MSTLEINKIVGAVLLVLLVTAVINLVGEALVRTAEHQAPAATVATAKPKPPKAPAATATAAPAPVAPLLAAADPTQGRKVAKKCRTCHSFAQGGKNKVGPNLWNIVNADKAGRAGFRYSKALRALGGRWTYADLDAFLAKPKAFAKGTKMTFAGIKKAADRAALIAYLRSLSDSPAPLP